MVPEAERAARVKDLVRRLRWKGPVFEVSALARQGLEPLLHAIWEHVAALQNPAQPEADPRFDAAAAPPAATATPESGDA
jgi:GTP-binding protein